jgi:hypothetical protein
MISFCDLICLTYLCLSFYFIPHCWTSKFARIREREREREREEMHLKYLHKLTLILDEFFELKSYSMTSKVGEMHGNTSRHL